MVYDSTSRKFIDLIRKASDKWANWNPPHQIKVGDYGKIDKDSGQFEREGNIYEDTYIYDDGDIATLIKHHPPISAPREDVYIATSAKKRQDDVSLGPKVSVPGLAEASIKGQFVFGSERGALLIMACPRSSYIPPETLKHLIKVEALVDMHLVTEVFICPAYSLYLSSGSNEAVDVALVGSFPVPHVPGLTAGGEIEAKWWSNNTSGLFRSARDPHGKDDYSPLYMLKKIPKRRSFFDFDFGKRGDLDPGEDEVNAPDCVQMTDLPVYSWDDVEPPWSPLDEDGNEEEFVDTVFDD